MKIVLAPDSFKGCLTALQVCEAMEGGIRQIYQAVEIEKVPMADGGEGTVQSLVDATDGRIVGEEVSDPLGNRVEARFGILGGEKTAVIEMAAASGLDLVPKDKRNPMLTTTYGTGELIRSALDRGCRELIVGIGGSATVDGGAGMAQALGARLLDRHGNEIPRGGGGLRKLDRIDLTGLDPRIAQTRTLVASDVDNPLVGPNGASVVYGPQKGATPEMVKKLDRYLDRYADIIKQDLGKDVKEVSGAGAAGGLGAGLMAFLNAELKLGVEIVIEASHLDDRLRNANLVITGEGRIDGQTVFGKTPVGVAKTAKKYNVPVLGVGGSIREDAAAVYEHGIDALVSIIDKPMSLEEAMSRGAELVTASTARAMRLFRLGQQSTCVD